ncbi:MFS transporter OS=Streptomyces antimycoticus OX=68175 GN=SANT12839_031440 PE=4 SV=1 [Streptomyces antimycoticus]
MPVIAGLVLIAAGSIALAVLPASAPVWASALLLIPAGMGGPLVMPPTTAVLLEHVPAEQTGTASGVFNTSRQIGGALAVAVFGALISSARPASSTACASASPWPPSSPWPRALATPRMAAGRHGS